MRFIANLILASVLATVYGSSDETTSNLRSLSTAEEDMIMTSAETDRCTTIIVGPKAGVEGSMTTHTADCLNCDFRVGKVGLCFIYLRLHLPKANNHIFCSC